MGAFAFVPAAALFLYLLEACVLVAAKKNRLITTFMVMLVFLIVWSSGSLLMRTQFLGLTTLWYHVSLSGVWLATIVLDVLLCMFQRRPMALIDKIMSVAFLVLVIGNATTSCFLAPPDVVQAADGTVSFVYSTVTAGTYVMYAISMLFILVILRNAVGCIRCRSLTSAQALPIAVGTVVMMVGQVLILTPLFSGIPIDIAAGVVFAIACFISLYNRHLFPLTLALSQRTYVLVTLMVVMVLSVLLVNRVERDIAAMPEPLGSNSVVCVVVMVVALAFFTFGLCSKLSEKLFLKDQTSRSESVRTFQESISRLMSVSEISQLYCQQIRNDLGRSHNVRVCLRNPEGNMVVVGSTIPFEAGMVFFDQHSAVVDWLERCNDVMTMGEFTRSVEYRSMWESERQALRERDPYCIIPLTVDDELIGLTMLSFKDSHGSLSLNEMDHLLSLSTIMAVCVKNSQLYELAAHEARTDDLTGLLNRKHFVAELERCYDQDPSRVMSLILINIDDFKLYNQLYGEKVADEALRQVARIVSQTAGEGCVVGRYGGKEFAVLMPDRDASAAKRLAEGLCQQIYQMNRDGSNDESLKILTCSIGICSLPFDAHTVDQLLSNANMAVYQVKQRGKNAIMVYSTGAAARSKESQPTDHKTIYASYADTIAALTAAIDAKDHYTFTHSRNVSYYASVLAEAYGLNAETVEIVREAAILHDIGKISIPESILKKPGRLTAEEYEVMKKHPENAVSIIRHLPSMEYVIPAVVGHHEMWNGRGYPRRLAGEDIPLTARILCVADCLDAMTTRRCYQQARGLEEALSVIQNGAGEQFDPELAKLFVELVRQGRIEVQAARGE